MSLTKQNITSEQASKLNLSLQVSHSALQYCVMSDSKIEQADIRKFNRDKSTEENLSVLFGALPALNLPYKDVAIILATEKVCLVPDELADGDALAYMHANGIQIEKDEQLLHSSSNGITAIMAAPTFLVQKAQTLYGDHTHWLHPLQIAIAKAHQSATLEVNFCDDWANITIKDDRLRYAETLPCAEITDLLFYIQQLNQQYNLRDFDLLLTGENTAEIRKELKSYYKPQLDSDLKKRIPKSLRNDEINFNNLIYCFDANR